MWDAFQACPEVLQARSEPDPPALTGRTGRLRKQVRASVQKDIRERDVSHSKVLETVLSSQTSLPKSCWNCATVDAPGLWQGAVG